MKKNTEIVLLITGITLAALWWVLFDRDDKDESDTTKKNDDVSSEEKEDVMVTEVIHPDQYDSFVKVNRPFTRKLPKRIFKGLDRNVIKLNNEAFYKMLQDNYETTQLTITNTSDIEREVRLWAGNKKPPLSPTLPGDVADHIFRTITVSSSLGTGIYPQGIIVNPFNGFIYIANQLSNNISILNTEGVLISLVPIPANGSSLLNPAYGWGPVDLTVNSQLSSPNFGKVYVANVVGDTITVINAELEAENTIQVGKRPIGIAFNPFNSNVYVANIAEDTVSVIDTVTETVIETIGVGKAPRNIAIVPNTESVYVVNSGDDSISVIDTNNQVSSTIENVGSGITTAAYHPVNNSLYVVSSGDNTVIPIDLGSETLRDKIPVGADTYRVIYNTSNELLYVGNRADDSYSIIDSNDIVIDTLFLGTVGTGIAIDPSDKIYSSDSTNGAINLISYSRESNKVLINNGYYEKQVDFTFSPAIVKHVKFVLSGTQRFRVLKLEEETVTGTTLVKPISFSSYNSPQNFGNVAEVFEMNGAIIDGKNGWVFKIAEKQTITILTYYKQRDRIDLNQII